MVTDLYAGKLIEITSYTTGVKYRSKIVSNTDTTFTITALDDSYAVVVNDTYDIYDYNSVQLSEIAINTIKEFQSNIMTASTTKNYTCNASQNEIHIINEGTSAISVTVNGVAHTVLPSWGWFKIGKMASFTTFTVTSSSQLFYVCTKGASAATLTEAV